MIRYNLISECFRQQKMLTIFLIAKVHTRSGGEETQMYKNNE